MGITIYSVYNPNGIHLDAVSMHVIKTEIKYATYEIPGKMTPTIDADTFAVKPTQYIIEADINDAEKGIIEGFRANWNNVHYLVDDSALPFIKTLRFESIEFRGNVTGNITDIKWKVSMSLIAVDH